MEDVADKKVKTRKTRRDGAGATRRSAEVGAHFGVEWEPCQHWLRTMGMKIFCPEVGEFDSAGTEPRLA